MILRDHLPLRRVWPHISRRLCLLFLFDLTVAILYTKFGFHALAIPHLPLAIIGAALSVFLAFRNNSAYDRWWEARTLWGGIVNNSRTFGRQALTLIGRRGEADEANEQGRQLIEIQIAWMHALRCHLRGQNPFPELAGRLDADTVRWLRTQSNVPIALLLRISQKLKALFDARALDSIRFTQIDGTVSELCNLQGACERIKNTPLPRQYEYFPRLLVAAYCVLLPFGLVGGMGILTPLASTLVSFIFVSLDSIGRDIETPFENTVHDIPMNALTRTIEINLRQNLDGKTALRELAPIDGFVY